MRLNPFNNINAAIPLVQSGDELRRLNSADGNSTSSWSVKGNSYRFTRNRFLTKVRGNFGSAGQNINVLVCSIRGQTGIGNIIEVLLDGNAFVSVAGYQEITLSVPIFLHEGTRYIIAFRRPDGSGVSMAFQFGNAAIDYGELITSSMVRSNAIPAPGVNLIDTGPGDLWVVDITTVAALPATPNPIPSSSPTKLLCHFDQPDNSVVFIDQTGKTMTAVGNAQHRKDQSKFLASSGRFDGTGDRVTVPDNDDWNVGTTPYTLEMFVRLDSKIVDQTFVTHWEGSVGISQWAFYLEGSTLKMRFAYGGSFVDIGAAWTPTLGVWYHLCVDRDGSGFTRIYVDGVVHASASSQSASPNSSCTHPLVIGAIGNTGAFPSFDFNGWIDELRFTKGVARYAGAFTPPVAPFLDR